MHTWGRYLLDTSLVLPGETLEWGPLFLQAVEVDDPSRHLRVASALYGNRVRALQLVWADEGDRWPWQVGYRSRAAGQPVLGAVAPRCAEHAPDRLDVPPHPEAG